MRTLVNEYRAGEYISNTFHMHRHSSNHPRSLGEAINNFIRVHRNKGIGLKLQSTSDHVNSADVIGLFLILYNREERS